jgi:hypothetical protein
MIDDFFAGSKPAVGGGDWYVCTWGKADIFNYFQNSIHWMSEIGGKAEVNCAGTEVR